MKAYVFQSPFEFVKGAVTSRGVIHSKLHFFVCLTDENGKMGWGECAPIMGLTPESEPEIRRELLSSVLLWESGELLLSDIKCSAVKVAFEMALGGLKHQSSGVFFHHDDAFNICVNGLVWMNEPEIMLSEARELLANGYQCVKLKVDGKQPEHCLSVLRKLRTEFAAKDLRIRLDANGSFALHQASFLLNELAKFEIESIEQPVASGHWNFLAELCGTSPVPIALDEELIGIVNAIEREDLLERVHPSALILKPSLHGGFASCEDWIERCERHNVGWWCTSYLESNLGLSALAQWLTKFDKGQTHGLGTGKLYQNNFEIPASVERGVLSWRGRFFPSFDFLKAFTQIS